MVFSWREEVRVAQKLPQMIVGSTEPGKDPLWVKSVFNATRLSCDARDLKLTLFNIVNAATRPEDCSILEVRLSAT